MTGHLPYANPAAPKGGTLNLPGQGGFDSLNPFILRGTAPDTILGMIWQPLFKLSDTDSVTEYAELARAVRVDGRTVTFFLDPQARFSDGVRLTAADVVWTFQMLTTQGLPFYASAYGGVARVRAADDETVVFTLKDSAGPDTVFNLGGMYVLPAHFWKSKDFSAPLRAFPVGSGPYRVASVSFGNSITYTHVADWWAGGLPVEAGFDNFDDVTEEFFQSKAALLQAFRAGQLDAHVEGSAIFWENSYDFAAVRDGRVKLATVPETLPAGMFGLAFNTRRKTLFGDVRVREALALAYDFQWANAKLFDGAYMRDDSYFANSAMAGRGAALPVTDGSGYNVPALRQAMALFRAAGWHLDSHLRLVDASGVPFRLEILLDDQQYERIAIPYAADLKWLGIAAVVRTLDPTAYQQRLQNFDFDMTDVDYPETDYPGAELAGYFGCASAKTPGGLNVAGICSAGTEAAIAAEEAARTVTEKRAAVQALDRLLLNGWYVVPWFYSDRERLAWWASRVSKPDTPLQVGHDFSLWWAK